MDGNKPLDSQPVIIEPQHPTSPPPHEGPRPPVGPHPPKPPRRKGRMLFPCLFTCFILFLIFLIAFAGWWAIGGLKDFICSRSLSDSPFSNAFNCAKTSSANANFDQGQTITIDKSKISNQEDLITQIVAAASPAVVTIAASSQLDPSNFENGIIQPQNQNIGSGFVVKSDGLIVTNSHVVETTGVDYSVILSTDKTPIPVKSIAMDTANDIAILKIDKTNLPTLKLGDSDIVKQGNTVVAIGSPLGDLTGSVTTGIISGLNRDLTASNASGGSSKSYQGVFQTDAAINPGNSGGPLLNSSGEVIGVNFATTATAENVSFSLPINRVKIKLTEFLTKGKLSQPYVGVGFTQRTYYLQDGSLTGALISQIQTGSPADKAGIKVGDLILKVNDKSLETNSLQNVIQSSQVGDVLTMNVWRKGTKMDIKVTVGDRGDAASSTRSS